MAEKEINKVAEKNKKKVKVGTVIAFARKGYEALEGTVTKVNEESVIVEVPQSVKDLLEIATSRTVINHKNYKII